MTKLTTHNTPLSRAYTRAIDHLRPQITHQPTRQRSSIPTQSSRYPSIRWTWAGVAVVACVVVSALALVFRGLLS
jgi:hypothetical protein